MAFPATLLLALALQARGQEPIPTPDPTRTVSANAGSVTVDMFTDSACTTPAFTLSAWEQRCTPLGSSAASIAPADPAGSKVVFYSVAQQQCLDDAARAFTATLLVYQTTTPETTGQCGAGTESFPLVVTLDAVCRPLPSQLAGWYRAAAITCAPTAPNTVFTLRTYAAAGCTGAVSIGALQLGNCTRRGYRGSSDVTFNLAQTTGFNVLGWAAGQSCSAAPATATQAMFLAMPSQPDTAAANLGCIAAAGTPASGALSATLREARVFLPQGAGVLPDMPLSNIAVAAIIIGSLVLLLLGFYCLLKNNLLCRAAPVQKSAGAQRKDVTAGAVPRSVRNPIPGAPAVAAETGRVAQGPGAVAVPNVLYGAGIKEFK